MDNERTEKIRQRVLGLISAEYESDAAFERDMDLKEKTVNNWRRGRSASFMRMLPALSEKFSVNVGEILDMPIRSDTSDLSDDELSLLKLYRKTSLLPEKAKEALRENLEATINLYITAFGEEKPKRGRRKQ